MNPDDRSIPPTFDNRLRAWLFLHGVTLTPAEYLVREARCIRQLAAKYAGKQNGAERLAREIARVEAHPEWLLDDRWAPQPLPSFLPADQRQGQTRGVRRTGSQEPPKKARRRAAKAGDAAAHTE
jgi:hypothetical protein